MGMYIPAPTGPDDNDEEKQRMLRDYLASSSPDPKPTADMQPSQFTAGGPTTQLEQTGNAAMHADDPAPEPAAPVAPPPTAAAPVQAPADDKRDVLMQLLAQKGIDRINKPEAPEQKPVDINDSGSLNPFAAIGSVAALGLDAAMNRGRGAGQIVGATANNIDADMRAHREEQTKLAEIAAKRKDDNDPLKQYLGLANVNARDYGNFTQRQSAGTSALGLQSRIDPNSEAAQGRVALTKESSTARREGLLEANHSAADDIAGDAAKKTTATTAAADAQKHTDNPIIAGDRAEVQKEALAATAPDRIAIGGAIAGAQAGARQPFVDQNREAADAQKAADEQRRIAAAAEAAKNKPLTPEQVAGEAQKFTDKTKFALDSARDVKDLEDVIGKYKEGDIPGVGVVNGRVPDTALEGDAAIHRLVGKTNARAEDALQIRRIQSAMANAIERPESGAAIGIQEDQKYLVRQGAKPGATEQEFRQGLDAYKRAMQAHIAGNRVGREDIADRVIAAHGIDKGWLGLKDTAPATAAPTRAAGAPSSSAPLAGDSLPVTSRSAPGGHGESRGTPDLPKTPGGAVMRTITFSDGTKESRALTQEQVDRILSRDKTARAD